MKVPETPPSLTSNQTEGSPCVATLTSNICLLKPFPKSHWVASLAVQRLRLWISTAGGTDLSPGPAIRAPPVMWCIPYTPRPKKRLGGLQISAVLSFTAIWCPYIGFAVQPASEPSFGNSFWFQLLLATWHIGSLFPKQGSNPCPLHWKCGVLPGKSLAFHLQTLFHVSV